jgi:hypothetical protein
VRPFLDTRVGSESGRARGRHRRPEVGFRRRRLRHRPLKAKPEAPAALQVELAARLAEGPEAWDLLCGEAAPVRRHPTLTAQWGVVEDVPEGPTGADPTTGPGYGAGAPRPGRPPSL